jgi:hypothetical protein
MASNRALEAPKSSIQFCVGRVIHARSLRWSVANWRQGCSVDVARVVKRRSRSRNPYE